MNARAVIIMLLSLAGHSNNLAAQEDPGSTELKPSRSEFDMSEFKEFISHHLSRPLSRGSLVGFGNETRTVHGRVVDHTGKPVAGALVAFAEQIGYSGQCYDENFDKTDRHGRFLVQGGMERTRVVVFRGVTAIWNVQVNPDQLFVSVNWPKPATCQLIVDGSICKAGSPVAVTTTRYWAGMSVLRFNALLDEAGTAVVENLLPGDYFVTKTKSLKAGKQVESIPVEIGSFSIKAGDNKRAQFSLAGKRTVHGKVAIPKVQWTLHVQRPRTQYEDWWRTVDVVRCAEDGAFTTRPLEPGKYLLKFVGPRPTNGGQFGAGRFRPTLHKRIEVPEKNAAVLVKLRPSPDSTIEFIHKTLDSEPTGRWSHTDVQVAALTRHADREVITKELLRIVHDPTSPYRWRDPAVKALIGMESSDEVVESLLANLDSADVQTKSRLIRAFENSKSSTMTIIDGIASCRKDRDLRVRWAAYYTLARLAQAHSSNRDKVVQLLMGSLSDPWVRIRCDVAASLGRLKAAEALPGLRQLREDPIGQCRVWAAWAIWKITGQEQQAINLMTTRLYSDTLSGKWESAYLLADFAELPAITVKALLSVTRFDGKPPFTEGDAYERHRIKQTALATLKKRAPDAIPSTQPASKR